MMKMAVVVGNPKPASKTLAAAVKLAEDLTGAAPDPVIDLITLGGSLLVRGDASVTEAIAKVSACEVAVIASPTYKATYTGLLKLFLDQFPAGGLGGVIALPLMLGAGQHHALAPELLLKPVLVELGAICPVRGLYLLDSDFRSAAVLEPWLAVARKQIACRADR